jgi:hypothetical protein
MEGAVSPRHKGSQESRLRCDALPTQRRRFNSLQVAELLAIASGRRRKTSEGERIEAARRIWHEYRLQVAEYRDGEREVVDPILMQAVGGWGLDIFAQADPDWALVRFLGLRQRPGKRAKNEERNGSITLAMINHLEASMTVADATELVAEAYGLSSATVRKIYYRRRTEITTSRHGRI